MRGNVPGGVMVPNPASPDIQVSGYETFMRRLFGIKRSGLLTGVDPHISLSIDPTTATEWQYLQNIRLLGGSIVAPAAAAVNSHVFIVNPVGSGMIVVVSSLLYQSGAADISTVFYTETANVTGLAGFASVPSNPTDTRNSKDPVNSGSVSLVARAQTAAVVVNQRLLENHNTASAAIQQFVGPVVLSPGFSLGVRTNTVLTQLTLVACAGYERVQENSEK